PVRHEPDAATVRVVSPEPGATDGLRDADGNLVLVELDFTRLEPVPPSQAAPNGSAAPAEPPPVPLAAIPADRAAIPPADVLPSGPDSIQAGVPVPPTPSSSPSAAPVPAEPSPERHSAASSVERAAFPSVAERLSESDRNPAAASVPAESASQLDVAVRNDQSPASPRPAAPVYQGLAAVPDKGATVTVSAAVSPAPDSSRFAVPVPEAPADGTLTATSTDSPNPVLSPAPAPGNPNVAAKSAPAKSAAAVNAAAPGGDVASPASAAPAVSATETATLTGIPNPADDPVSSSPSAGHSGTVPEPASAATTDNAATAAAVVGSSADQSVLAGSSSSNPAEPVAFDPAKPLGPLRVASVTTPKSVSVEYVGEGTLRITCVTRDTNGKPVSKTVVTEKVQPENLRAGYYITHPGLRGLFIKTAGKVSLEESHDPAVSDPVDLTEQSLLPLEGGTNAATHPHAARRDELHSFAGGVPVAGEDDAVYAIQSLEMDKIGRVTFGGKDYSLADVKLGGAADLAGNSLLTLQILAEATDDIAALRDRLGAFKANMLEHNIRSLDVAIENIAVTEHAIHDSRTAEERVSFTRGMMLDQSGTSILAQANQKSQNVISLLQ
ncbi:MAG: hypothetical protein LIQ30_05890, partial [Planctomycetes bacterium]|nr:hypothetical protein [Planctomycetota bacterium]